MLVVHDGFDGLAHGLVNIWTQFIIIVNSLYGGKISSSLKEIELE